MVSSGGGEYDQCHATAGAAPGRVLDGEQLSTADVRAARAARPEPRAGLSRVEQLEHVGNRRTHLVGVMVSGVGVQVRVRVSVRVGQG